VPEQEPEELVELVQVVPEVPVELVQEQQVQQEQQEQQVQQEEQPEEQQEALVELEVPEALVPDQLCASTIKQNANSGPLLDSVPTNLTCFTWLDSVVHLALNLRTSWTSQAPRES